MHHMTAHSAHLSHVPFWFDILNLILQGLSG